MAGAATTARTKAPAPRAGPAISKEPSGRSGRRFKFFFKLALGLFLLLVVAGAVLYTAIHFNIIDVSQTADKWKLYDNPIAGPVISRYFPKPEGNLPPPETADNQKAPAFPAALPQPPAAPESPAAAAPGIQSPLPAPSQTPSADIDKQIKERQQEEAKRYARLARVYGSMKPEEAAAIIKELDDATVIKIFAKMDDDQVAKIMALLDAPRAARLSNLMLERQY